jgi:hypothetical protein
MSKARTRRGWQKGRFVSQHSLTRRQSNHCKEILNAADKTLAESGGSNERIANYSNLLTTALVLGQSKSGCYFRMAPML